MATKTPQDHLLDSPANNEQQVALISGQHQNSPDHPNKRRKKSSASVSDQVITSLQVNSKKATLPDRKSASKKTADSQAGDEHQVALLDSQRPTSGRVLDPSGALYHHWSMVVSLAFLYNFWSLSYRFAFREIDFDTVAFWFALDYLADLIYVLDVVINSRTGYLEDGVLQRKREKISQHYRECTLFYLDCFCLLPLDILYLSIGFNSILRCTRLVKIYKFWSYVDRTERHTNYPNVFRTFTLVHYILVIFHWNACLFHMISKNKIIDIEDLYRINDNRCHDILCQYLHAFYWSTLALTTIGDLPRPRTKGEYLYVIVELFFGLFLFASVLGHVANIVTNVSAARKEFQAKLDAVKTFMRMRRVSDELQNKVIRWFDYLWISQKSSDEERSVACLPDRLKAEIAIHVHLDTLKRVDIFQNTEAGFLCELVLRLKPVLFSPGDYVCRKNEVGHEMYIVSRGILEVVTDEGKRVVATLKAGSYFGEISVLNVGLAGNKRTASVRSVGYSDLFCLNKQDLWDVLKNYPNAEARIRARAEERLSKLAIPRPPAESGPPRRRLCSAGSGRHMLLAPPPPATLRAPSCCADPYSSAGYCTRSGNPRRGSRARGAGSRQPENGASRSLDCGLEAGADHNDHCLSAGALRSDSHRIGSSRDTSPEDKVTTERQDPNGGATAVRRPTQDLSPETGDRCRARSSRLDSDCAIDLDGDQLACSHKRPSVQQPRLSSGSVNSSCLGAAHFQPVTTSRRRCCRLAAAALLQPADAHCRHGRPRRSRRRRQLPHVACHAHCDELSDAEVPGGRHEASTRRNHLLLQPTAYWQQQHPQQQQQQQQHHLHHHHHQAPSQRHHQLTPIIQVPFTAAAATTPDGRGYQLLQPIQLTSAPVAQSVSMTQLSAATTTSVVAACGASGVGGGGAGDQSQVVSSQTQTPSPVESQWLLLGHYTDQIGLAPQQQPLSRSSQSVRTACNAEQHQLSQVQVRASGVGAETLPQVSAGGSTELVCAQRRPHPPPLVATHSPITAAKTRTDDIQQHHHHHHQEPPDEQVNANSTTTTTTCRREASPAGDCDC